MLNNSLTFHAGLLRVPVAVVAVVVSAAVPFAANAEAPDRAAPDRAAFAELGASWREADALDPFADEDLADDRAFEARLAAEDNLELL